ncbi:hypothetical protein WICANDRAFT_91750 [Wickerhamomyces anomalus NRRL Y-366-8]|uniref:serine C-palmitoyltransferase n=1 Tax=Wickerhamomyces anomalus (strain ATCC 58044 / CBS 1984 / NCYC 433 / NRRL Y-366-8) TaxID=683960 RepID=A0A1E3P2V8_WICAA|nr:uncharacterized protein WICANDRAFT_91750 [Wickerhamomyces anomalus NRRL Y-366-8]ODQ59819.1 hypothetical protein WICANDRAFT_91750 [Wickerhamomyces anomalus NRRL Y-366-8]
MNSTLTTSIAFQDIWNSTSDVVSKYLIIILSYMESIPGGSIIVRYIKSSHKNDPIRTLFEIALLGFAIKYFTTAKYERKKKDYVRLNQNEIDDLIDDWIPEPLVQSVESKESWQLDSIPIVKGPIDTKVELIDTHGAKILNFASNNFLNFGVDSKVKKECSKVIHSNGVGACGPPNFYGNQDIHIKLENDLASFFGTESAVLYGQDFCTAGSVLPSFLKRNDTVIADSSVNVAIQKALILSRCDIYWYNHNDLEHLEQIMKDLNENVFKYEKPISRKFIITEDESFSLGVLGKTGKGLAEEFNIERSEVDITIGSMANAFCSSGGFCIGDRVMSYHQRIGSMAYCFSASLPAYVARATSVGIQLIKDSINEKNGESSILSKLHGNNKTLYDLFSKDSKISKLVEIKSCSKSSILHLEINSQIRSLLNLPTSYTGTGSELAYRIKKELNNEELLLQKIIDEVKSQGILITRSRFTYEQESLPLIPHLKIHSNVDFDKGDLIKAHDIISKIIVNNLDGITLEKFTKLANN